MRYFLTGLILFLIMAFFVRSWYVQQFNTPEKEAIILKKVNQSPEDSLKVIFSDFFILDDNLLLKPDDYSMIARVVAVLRQKPNSKLIVSMSEALNAPKVKNTLTTILEDQGIKETRFQFLRKPSKRIDLHKVLFQVL